MKYIVKSVFIFCVSFLFSQTGTGLTFNFFNPSIKLYVIGEAHFEYDGDLQVALIDYILKSKNVDVFVWEIATDVADIYNEYVQHGTMEKEVDVIRSLISKEMFYKTKQILSFLRQYNLNHSHKIQIKGIDMFGFSGLKRQSKALSTVFPELKKVDLPLVSKYITNPRTNNYNKRKSLNIIKNLLNEVADHTEEYRKYLGERLVKYKEYLSHLEYDYADYSWRESDSIREAYMGKKLTDIVDSNLTSMMICGDDHAMYKETDNYYGFPITSASAVVRKKYPEQVFSIVTQYYDKKLFRLIPELNLLNQSMEHYLQKNNNMADKYVIVDDDTFKQSPFAVERCDMIIIYNKRYKKYRK